MKLFFAIAAVTMAKRNNGDRIITDEAECCDLIKVSKNYWVFKMSRFV